MLGLASSLIPLGTAGIVASVVRVNDPAVVPRSEEIEGFLDRVVDAIEIGFNAEFLRDGIESVGGEQLRLKLISPLRPAVLQGEDDAFLYLIMPIRLAG